METDIRRIIDDLNLIKDELHQIKQNMPDKEMFLTVEEAKLLEESRTNEKNKKLVSSKALRKKLGI
jgi:hypothetical protein